MAVTDGELIPMTWVQDEALVITK